MKSYSHIRYMYLRDNRGAPHTCIVIQLDRDLDVVNFQFCTLSSKDNKQFYKSGARYIACQRLNKNPIGIEMNLTGATSHEITREILASMTLGMNGVSQRAINSSRKWLKKHVENRPTLPFIPVAVDATMMDDVNQVFDRIHSEIMGSDAAESVIEIARQSPPYDYNWSNGGAQVKINHVTPGLQVIMLGEKSETTNSSEGPV